MCTDLGVAPYSGENFYAAEVQDMTAIIQRIISDGKLHLYNFMASEY